MLTEQQAVEIYSHKLSLHARRSNSQSSDTCLRSLRGKCGRVAKMFGVSPRAVRDIWNRYTWEEATCHLWEHEEEGAIKISETCSSSKVFDKSCSRVQLLSYSDENLVATAATPKRIAKHKALCCHDRTSIMLAYGGECGGLELMGLKQGVKCNG